MTEDVSTEALPLIEDLARHLHRTLRDSAPSSWHDAMPEVREHYRAMARAALAIVHTHIGAKLGVKP